MRSTRGARLLAVVLSLLGLMLIPGLAFAGGSKEAAGAKPTVTFFWALYDGLTENFRADLQSAFMKANPDIKLDIVPVPWDQLHDKLTTSLAGGQPPEISVIGTRWLLEFMGLNAIAAPTDYVSQSTIADIKPGAMEAKIDGKLWGIPVAAGARIMAINTSLTDKVPQTMEELEKDAIAANDPPNHYGIIMIGKKNTELTDFAYYFYAAGGNFFGPDGKSTVNSPAGVKALTFMNKLANVDKVVQPGYLGQTRMESDPVFYAGKAAYDMIGAWVGSAMKQAGATFPVKYTLIPPFEGQQQTSLIITDSIAFFKPNSETNLKAAGKFIDFFYQPQWKGKFDELVGFPPVTYSAAKLPAFDTPLYRILGDAAVHAKGWPLIAPWPQDQDMLWDAVSKVFLGQASPQQALDEAAAQIDKINAK